MKDKKGIKATNAFQKLLNESNHKANNIWVNKGSEFYNTLMKSWLQDNNIEMYSAHNEGKSVITEISIRTFKNKIYKYMNSVLKNVYIDKLDDQVNKYNTYYSTIKMKLVNVNSKTYIDFCKENNQKTINVKLVTM